jgi:CheY-like chemotaxis protein
MTIEEPIILLVEDSENDALLMCTVFDRAGLGQPLRFARNGDQAMAYLRGDGIYADRVQYPLPTALLLDLNLPGMNGLEVLTWIRQQPRLKRLRVYVLSASSRSQDIREAYDQGANAYLIKPGNLDGLMHLARILVAWLKLSQFAAISDTDETHAFPRSQAPVDGTVYRGNGSMPRRP